MRLPALIKYYVGQNQVPESQQELDILELLSAIIARKYLSKKADGKAPHEDG